MHPIFADTATNSPGLFEALGINWKLLVIQAIAFLILLAILSKWVFPVLVKAIDERRDMIEAGLKEAQASHEALEKAESKVEDLLAEARRDADALMKRAQSEAAGVVADAEGKAKARSEQIVADAHTQLEADIRQARQALKRDTAELVALATEKVIHEKLDDKKDTELVERALAGDRV